MRTERLKIIFLMVCCLWGNSLSAQTIHKPGQYKIDQHIITAKETKYINGLLVQEKDSIISIVLRNPRKLTRVEDMTFSSRETINSSMVSVLGIKHLKELIYDPNKVDIVVTLYLIADKGKGKVEAVQFMILNPKETRLTPEEIHRLTRYMKKNITIGIPPDIPSGNQIAPFTQSVKFSRLINQ